MPMTPHSAKCHQASGAPTGFKSHQVPAVKPTAASTAVAM